MPRPDQIWSLCNAVQSIYLPLPIKRKGKNESSKIHQGCHVSMRQHATVTVQRQKKAKEGKEIEGFGQEKLYRFRQFARNILPCHLSDN